MWENERESVREEAERKKKEVVYRQKQKTEDVVFEETLEESSEPMNGAQWQVVPTRSRATNTHTHTRRRHC